MRQQDPNVTYDKLNEHIPLSNADWIAEYRVNA